MSRFPFCRLGNKCIFSFSQHRFFTLSRLFFILLYLAFPAQAQDQEQEQVELEKLTWTEILQKEKAGTRTIIIPIGGTEQSGPYIAIGKHNARVASLAQQIAQQVGHTLVAPVIAYVPEGNITPPTSHMRFPGTISIPEQTFKSLLISTAESFQTHGFNLIVFIGDHGGYQHIVADVAQALNKRWAKEGRAREKSYALYVPEYYSVLQTHFNTYLRQHGFGQDIGKHADINDTSLMLAVDPSYVRLVQLRNAPAPTAQQGIYGGDPRKASAELGQQGITYQIKATIKAIQQKQILISGQ
ncbi:creatininase family protein [Entomobacter blattae]|uniref:Creatinine amidohydrolase n=1 Tax=Entomobacter blattae TaxID=2762277 RepID=A0A7H1NNJ1_9PROT|nr:creatininase family protein [Entomobacter blattae]QNT77351.1 Creatinine amidohydrolase [Entomobacter blattae]